MKFNSTLLALSVAALFATGTANAAITGTPSAKLTVQSTITAGTCTAKVTNSAGADATEVNFGDVYKADLENKSRVEPLKISFTGCAGVKKPWCLRRPVQAAHAQVITWTVTLMPPARTPPLSSGLARWIPAFN